MNKVLDLNTHELYLQAKEGFLCCIRNVDNSFLKEEVDIPLENIIPKKRNIKIVCESDENEDYYYEVSHWLFGNEILIGEYVAFLNQNKEIIDDKLVFY